MSYDWGYICKLREELNKYAQLECNSHGEMVVALCDLSQYPDYLSEEMARQLISDMDAELQNYKKNAIITETEETFTRKIIDIEWR